MSRTTHPKVPVVEVCASLASCRTAQMIEVMLNFALETGHYNSEELHQLEEVGALQRAALT